MIRHTIRRSIRRGIRRGIRRATAGRPARFTVSLVLFALLAGCSGAGAGPATSEPPPLATSVTGDATGEATGPELQAIVATSDIVVGENRLALGLLKDGQPLGEARVHERFFYLDAAGAAEQAAVRAEADAVYYGENLPLGVHVSTVRFDRPGTWGIEVQALEPGASEPLVSRVRLTVKETPSTPAVGSPAPASRNRTVADEPDLSRLTSDEHPDEDLYQLAIADAIASGRPTLVLFGTPKYCTSRTCGPVLELLKGLKRDYGAEANFIHVEIYSDFTTFTVVPEVQEWGLPSEPWLFLIDREGRIAAKFEGGITRAEVEPAVQALVGR